MTAARNVLPRTGRARWVLTLGVVAALAAGTLLVLRPGGGGGVAPAAGAGAGGAPAAPVTGPPDATVPDVDTAALTAALTQAPDAKIGPARLADGVVPPSNRWYSGLVFGPEPMPVFPLPLSFALADGGFTMGLPDPVTSERAIIGPHVPAVTVDVGAASAQVVAADPVAVTTRLLDASGAALGDVTVAAGSPFVSFTAASDVEVAAGEGFGALTDGAATAEVAGTTWGLAVSDGTLDGGTLTLPSGATAGWYALPDDASDDAAQVLAAAAVDPVVGVDVGYGVGDDVARTTLTYRTAGSTPSAHVLMRHHTTGTQPDREGCGLGTYRSVHGTLELCAGSTLTSYAPTLRPTGALDLDGVSTERRDAVLDQLAKDVAGTPPFASDTYFGGKHLYRAATLVTLGEQLGADDVVADLRTRTADALREWAQPEGCDEREARCFVYDEAARSVIGRIPNFGSEELNDHHFHYGYLLSAAGLLGADDPTLVDDVRPVMDALAADIAAAQPSDALPQLRTFDPYAGHAWASGTSPFADGNNQESASEAVNAWNGIGLWAAASGQDDLLTQATWLASTEAASARDYWTDPDLEDPVMDGFEHRVVALNWGGKRDWATWFSAEPSAMLGILLIPMGPVSDYLAVDVDAETILAAVDEATPAGPDVMFGDYLLMYRALAGPDEAAAAWQDAIDLPDTSVDDGSSRAYLLAWLAAHGA
ncbi:glycosyl hydrolase [Cellulomonas wangsupingiae]|uniref:glucan endo-1,3-beta-D-glucosidase n=1 Tax=Cellulomonas wangsupingiae TaxID=2968085 RepID=A0ABY5K6R6_9CELL|nr:glycosyl hydrolase [Cellulomonas wangsupingiae]MCC2336025.1 1,3-beta-glucanase [Cellulomonas wangsupingiae]MCM0639664.1 glycosyl hydrolase [Cellulomonas wangsupingiae]UUI64750.1 glycosyl hydrolase [Cellulomonas wangsupingiae]